MAEGMSEHMDAEDMLSFMNLLLKRDADSKATLQFMDTIFMQVTLNGICKVGILIILHFELAVEI